MCNAHNPDEADWCGQCLSNLRAAPEPGPEPEPSPQPQSSPPTGQVDTPTTQPPDRGAGDRRFRRHDGEFEWRCEICEEWNLVGLARCSVCGTSMGGPHDATGSRQPAAPGVVLLLTVLLPGAGHAALGLMATAWARGLTYLLWLLGGTTLLVTAISSGESVLPGIIPLLGALALWVITLLDVQSLLANRARQILDARVFLWLVVGVIGLLMLTFMATFSRVGGGGG